MDANMVKELLDFHIRHIYPEGLTSKQRFGIKRRAESFRIKDGDLHYICRRKKTGSMHLAKVVLSSEEANELFIEFHCSLIGGHAGMEKTHLAIIQRFYWPGMTEDIRKWIARCPQCQSKRAFIKEKKEYTPIEVTEPLELVGMDLVGKLTVTDGGNQEFCNKVNYNLCEKLAIKRSLCSPYHPQTNGLVEKLNGTIQRSLNKLVEGEPKRWDQLLQGTMFALRTKTQLTTKFSPYFLMFGREARYPSEVPKEYEITEEKVSSLVQMEEVFEGLKKQEAVFAEVKSNITKSQNKIRKKKEVIRDIWSGRRRETLWAKYGPYKIYSHNLLVLAPGEELEGEIVNAYLAWVGAKAGVFILDSYLMTSLWKGTHKGSLRKLDLSKHEVAAGAVCDGAHWTLIIMYLNENRSLFLNPLGATEEQLIRCKDVTRSLVRKHRPSVGRWACTTIAHPKQMDSTSCGVLVLKLAEQILQKQQVQYPVDQEGVASMRFHMAMALVNNSDIGYTLETAATSPRNTYPCFDITAGESLEYTHDTNARHHAEHTHKLCPQLHTANMQRSMFRSI
ncbi:hypothetical protein KUCAC02_011016 [Chaenocephalus aceratus]|uniref:Uncharacterized protein n=1 Tax=Chaenocephalus aceratus TaxID=36190 RepID=A0ACB9WV71_CHAAC|nr:hypothetical protein KUCAC02_011016 [Chaenocephalus aceratus]